MEFNDLAKAKYKELVNDMANIKQETKDRKKEIDKEMKKKKSKIKNEIAGLEKYLVAAEVMKKK